MIKFNDVSMHGIPTYRRESDTTYITKRENGANMTSWAKDEIELLGASEGDCRAIRKADAQ